jgi:hypothetical protein
VYNSRVRQAPGGQQIVNWNALAYFHEEDLACTTDGTNVVASGKPAEPLIRGRMLVTHKNLRTTFRAQLNKETNRSIDIYTSRLVCILNWSPRRHSQQRSKRRQ